MLKGSGTLPSKVKGHVTIINTKHSELTAVLCMLFLRGVTILACLRLRTCSCLRSRSYSKGVVTLLPFCYLNATIFQILVATATNHCFWGSNMLYITSYPTLIWFPMPIDNFVILIPGLSLTCIYSIQHCFYKDRRPVEFQPRQLSLFQSLINMPQQNNNMCSWSTL